MPWPKVKSPAGFYFCSVNHSKETLRAQLRQQRKELAPIQKQAWDQQLQDELLTWVATHRPQRVHTYLPLPEEVDFEPALLKMLHQGIQLYAPKTLPQGQLENRPLLDLKALHYGRFKTRYPATQEVYTGGYDLILVPALALDPHGYRLGYGGGYYDRLLSQAPYRHSLALAYPFQVLPEALPRQAHDQPVGTVLLPS